MALEDRALQLSLGQGHQVGRVEAQLEKEGSCRHAKAAFGFNTHQHVSAGPGRCLGGPLVLTGPKPHFWGPTKGPNLTGDTPKPSTRKGGALHCPTASLPPQLYISPPPGSQASIPGPKRSPADLSSGQEKCSARLCTLICAGL